MYISCGNDVAESEGQPLYAERTPDAPPVTWVHQTCLVPSYDGAEETEALDAFKQWIDLARESNRTPLERLVATAISPA